MTQLTDRQITDMVRNLPPLSDVVLRSRELLEGDNPDMNRLADILAQDPALSSSILGLANSPFYGFSKQIASIREACIMLGTHTVNNVVTVAGISETLPGGQGNTYDYPKLWQHAICVSVTARVIASHLGYDPELAFTAGLLHDIGKLVLDHAFPEKMKRVMDECNNTGCSPLVSEQKHLGTDHAEIGGMLAQYWKLPPDIHIAIKGHHGSDEGEAKPITDITHLANILAHVLDIGEIDGVRIPRISPGVRDRFGFEWSDIAGWLGQVETLLPEASSLLQQ